MRGNPGEVAENCGAEGEIHEPSGRMEVKIGSRQRRGEPGPQPGPRFSEETRRRVAGFFILLDEMDRAQARKERKAA